MVEMYDITNTDSERYHMAHLRAEHGFLMSLKGPPGQRAEKRQKGKLKNKN